MQNRERSEGYSRWKVEKGYGKICKTGLNNWSMSKSLKGSSLQTLFKFLCYVIDENSVVHICKKKEDKNTQVLNVLIKYLLSIFLLYTPHCHVILLKQKCCLWSTGVSTESQNLTSVLHLRTFLVVYLSVPFLLKSSYTLLRMLKCLKLTVCMKLYVRSRHAWFYGNIKLSL